MKAVLVIDMPKDCYDCPLSREDTIYDEHVFICIGYNAEIEDLSARADWCPLRPLPQKKEVDEQSLDLMWWSGEHDMAYDVGYNACLKEITGEEEKK